MADIIKLDGARQLDFDREMVEQAYDRWAPVYDLVFGGVFSKGRKAAIHATNKIGGRVLEVGVGTGISLPLYAPDLRIFGTDISEAMLEKAKKRVDELGLKNVEGLAVMDAEKLEFPDDSFDVVMAQYVVTAVPNPEKALDEFARVLRPGGELIILTRVSADAGSAASSSSGCSRWFARSASAPPSSPGRVMRNGWRMRAAWNWRSAAWCRRSVTSRWCVSARSRSPRLRSAWPLMSRHASLRSVTCQHHDVICRTSNPCKPEPIRIWGRE